MKLRNKKTGGLANIDELCVHTDAGFHDYNSLAELNDEWEDYEEPKEYWFIDFNGEIKEFEELGFKWQGWMKDIGNYFETEEEAKKAVEKLKAFKRLKDKGLEFVELRAPNYGGSDIITIKAHCLWNSKNIDDLGLLFRGEQ